MSWFGRLLAGVVALVLVAGLGAGGFAWYLIGRSTPTVEGELTVRGSEAPVEILRDAHGVPHVFAQSALDAFFGLGFAHGQDRFWQMHLTRRTAQGRLSEIFGADVLNTDIFFRTLDLDGAAAKALAGLDADSRASLDAYAAGVNAALENGGAHPLEFAILRLNGPEPWSAVDTVSVMKLMAYDLATNAWGEANAQAALAQLGPERAAQYLPPYPADAPIALSPGDLGLPDAATDPPRPPLLGQTRIEPENGSNNWVIGGAMTATGAPLLANDPHLSLTAPSIWYLAHLSFEGRDVYGATIAGLPGVILGRNRDVAWGFTNNGADVQDLYRERVNPDDPNQYLTPGGWRPFETRTETIAVKGGETVDVMLRRTRHGPVLPSDHAWSALAEDGEVIALAWTALADTDRSAATFRTIATAADAGAFVAALRDFQDPIQNVVFADRGGAFGYTSPARVPVRGPEHDTAGARPATGWDARNDWVRVAGPDDLPTVFSPKRGYVATANNMIVPAAYPLHLTFDRAWLRAARIEEVLREGRALTVDDMKRLQRDVLAIGARRLTPLMMRIAPPSPEAERAFSILAEWSFEMDAELVAPTIFAAWSEDFQRMVTEDDLGPLYRRLHRPRPQFLESVLAGSAADWCDDRETAREETCDELLSASLSVALLRLRNAYGEDLADWRWGRAHFAVFAHGPFEQVAPLRRWFSIRTPSSGGYFTVNRGYYRYDGDVAYDNRHGPGLRAVYDLSRPDGAWFMISTGQSGHVASPHYGDMTEPWAAGEYVQLALDRRRLMESGAARLIIAP